MRTKWECQTCGNMISVLHEVKEIEGPTTCSCGANVFKHINSSLE